jgi:predicted O-methyltransferase YrrM
MITHYSKTSFLNHPFRLASFMFGNKEPLHEVVLMRSGRILLGNRFDRKLAAQALREIHAGDFLPMREDKHATISGNKPGHLFGKFIYFFVRCLQPAVMVETGVAHGVSSWTILNAMHKNGKGKLYSIDLPDLDTKKVFNVGNYSAEPGWVVPDELRYRWELHLGSATELLLPLLQRLGKTDIFYHDSDHSYEHMKFEFHTAVQYIRPGGLLISDDVHHHHAFREIVEEKNLAAVQLFSKGGAAVIP